MGFSFVHKVRHYAVQFKAYSTAKSQGPPPLARTAIDRDFIIWQYQIFSLAPVTVPVGMTQIVRRTLFESDALRVGHVLVRPAVSHRGELECQRSNVLVLPLVGVFAKHEGPRRRVIGTPNHAVLIAAGSTYRISYPGAIGDECLTLWFSGDALERLVPRAVSRGAFDPRRFTSDALLPALAMLTRGLLWQRFVYGDWDPVEIEELGVGLLGCVLRVAGQRTERRRCAPVRDDRVARVKEAIAVLPERRWTLGALAQLAEVSPYYLAHTFREQVGVSVYRYLLLARLAGALDRVLDGDADLTAIALDTGFTSHSHFTARFRALFGMTPSEVRRRARIR